VDAGDLLTDHLAPLARHARLKRWYSRARLAASGSGCHTGPTGTNVGDLVMDLMLSAAAAGSYSRTSMAG